LHDGGTAVVVHQKFTNQTKRDEKLKSDPRFKMDTNGDVILCESRATYGSGGHVHMKRSMMANPSTNGSPTKAGKKHISAMSVCWDLGRISRDDGIYITASYDFNAHEPMKAASGGFAPVMGIAMVFAAADVSSSF
jgi:hypothetical protein